MVKATTVSAATPRNTQRQCRYSVTAPARKGPMSEGTTHAAEKAANTRPCSRGRVHAGDDDVQRDGLPAGAEPLHQPPDDEHRHRRRRAPR